MLVGLGEQVNQVAYCLFPTDVSRPTLLHRSIPVAREHFFASLYSVTKLDGIPAFHIPTHSIMVRLPIDDSEASSRKQPPLNTLESILERHAESIAWNSPGPARYDFRSMSLHDLIG